MRPLMAGGFNQRPAPYDRSDRFGGMNRYGGGSMGPMSRGSRNFKGICRVHESNKFHISSDSPPYFLQFLDVQESIFC